MLVADISFIIRGSDGLWTPHRVVKSGMNIAQLFAAVGSIEGFEDGFRGTQRKGRPVMICSLTMRIGECGLAGGLAFKEQNGGSSNMHGELSGQAPLDQCVSKAA